MTEFDSSRGDAMEYAEEFMRIFGNNREAIDTGTMFGWFANAMTWAKESVESQHRKAQAAPEILYGWGMVDKDGETNVDKKGATNPFLSAGSKNLLVYKVALLDREHAAGAPFRAVPLFYKEEKS